MTEVSLALHNVSVYRADDDGSKRPVIENLSLELAPGQRCMLVGPNGAGKTSLLLAMVGALPFTGEIRVDGVALVQKTLNSIRRQLGFVFANPDEQLFCESVWEEVAFGPRQLELVDGEQEARVQHALTLVGLRQQAAKNPHHLSLGEQRRVAVAAALATHPAALLFDEPTASLDPVARNNILAVLSRTEATVVMASHDLTAARELKATVALLNGGRLIATGDADHVLRDRELLLRAGLLAPDRTPSS